MGEFMSFFELFVLAIGLSMDAFAVAMCKGLAVKKVGIKLLTTYPNILLNWYLRAVKSFLAKSKNKWRI